MRRFLSPRWLGLHAAVVIIAAGFLVLGWWQLRRAEGGNALSWGYTFEWPLFAGFVVVFWLKVMRDELREVGAGRHEGSGEAAPVALPAEIGAARSAEQGYPDDEQEDEELAAYNAYLSRLNEEVSRSAGWVAARGTRRRAATSASPPRRAKKAGGGSLQPMTGHAHPRVTGHEPEPGSVPRDSSHREV